MTDESWTSRPGRAVTFCGLFLGITKQRLIRMRPRPVSVGLLRLLIGRLIVRFCLVASGCLLHVGQSWRRGDVSMGE